MEFAAAAASLDLPLDEVLILQSAHVKLLAAAARGEVDLNALARAELTARGLDADGNWVGFARARALA